METIILLGINELAKELSKLLMVECDELIIVDNNNDSLNELKEELSSSVSKCSVKCLCYNLIIKQDLNLLMNEIKDKNIIKVINNLAYIMPIDKSLIKAKEENIEDFTSIIYLNLEINRKIIALMIEHNYGIYLTIGYLSNNDNDLMLAKMLLSINDNLMKECSDFRVLPLLYLVERKDNFINEVVKINNFNPKRGKNNYIPIKFLNKF